MKTSRGAVSEYSGIAGPVVTFDINNPSMDVLVSGRAPAAMRRRISSRSSARRVHANTDRGNSIGNSSRIVQEVA